MCNVHGPRPDGFEGPTVGAVGGGSRPAAGDTKETAPVTYPRYVVRIGHTIDSGIGLSMTIDKLRVFINKTLSILNAYQ